MSLDHLASLFAHMAWADEEVGRALALAAEHSTEHPAPPSTEAHAEALELYAHLIGAELIWIDRLEGVPQSVPVWPRNKLEEALALAQRSRERYAAFLDRLEAQDLSRGVAYRNSAGQAFETPAHDILLHVALHGAYHRGQISRALRQGGGEPAASDYIAFVRGAPAATRADSP